MKNNKKFENNSQRAIIEYTEPSYAGIAFSYVIPSQIEEGGVIKSKFILIEDGEPLYKTACGAMVGDEVEIDNNGMIVKICSQSFFKRLKNYWFLFKKRKNNKKNTL